MRFDDVIVKDRLIATSIKKLIFKITKKSTDDEGPISRRVLAVEWQQDRTGVKFVPDFNEKLEVNKQKFEKKKHLVWI